MDSLLSIISSQRERFRAKNQELEGVSAGEGLGRGWGGAGGCRVSTGEGLRAAGPSLGWLLCWPAAILHQQEENSSCCEQEQSLPSPSVLLQTPESLCPCVPLSWHCVWGCHGEST